MLIATQVIRIIVSPQRYKSSRLAQYSCRNKLHNKSGGIAAHESYGSSAVTHITQYIENTSRCGTVHGRAKTTVPRPAHKSGACISKTSLCPFCSSARRFSFGAPAGTKNTTPGGIPPKRRYVSYKIYVSSVLLAQNHVAIVLIQNQRIGAVSRREGGEIACYTELWNGSRRMYRIALNNLNLKGYNIEVSVEGQLRRYRRGHPGLSHRVAGDGRSRRALYRAHRQPRREGARALTAQPPTRKRQKRDFHHTGRNPSFVILSCAPPAPGPDAAGYLPRPLCWPFFPPCHFIMARGNFIWAFLNLKSCSLERKLLNLS